MKNTHHDMPADLLSALRRARRVLVFTGAGISAESGIATFRDALTGLWSRFDAQALATPEAFRHHPDVVWGWYEWRRAQALQAQPNAGHLAIARLAELVPQLMVVTQNVDDLHERAGSTSVLHLHGSLHSPRCSVCHAPFALPAGIPEAPPNGRRLSPPSCIHCGGPVRPGVVWFGESLPQDAWHQAVQAAKECDLLFSIGTSALVYPAAELPQRASARGAVIVQINPGATPLDAQADFNLRGQAAELLPRLLQALSA